MKIQYDTFSEKVFENCLPSRKKRFSTEMNYQILSKDSLEEIDTQESFTTPHSEDKLIGGGDNDLIPAIAETVLNGVGKVLGFICWIPYIFGSYLISLMEWFRPDSMTDGLEGLIEFVNKKEARVLNCNSDKYYYEAELVIKKIISALKKLEEKMKSSSLKEEQMLLKLKILWGIPSIKSTDSPVKIYHDIFNAYLKGSSGSEYLGPAYQCLLFLIQDIKEELLLNNPDNPFTLEQLAGVRLRYGKELGLHQEPIFPCSAVDETKTLEECKKIFEKYYTRQFFHQSLMKKVDEEKNRSFFKDPLNLAQLLEAWEILANGRDVDELKKADVIKCPLNFVSDIFFTEDAINWDSMQNIPELKLDENDVSQISIEELLSIYQRVSSFNPS